MDTRFFDYKRCEVTIKQSMALHRQSEGQRREARWWDYVFLLHFAKPCAGCSLCEALRQ